MNLQDISVLVTGGSGFVGSYMAAGFAAAGARVRAIVRIPGNHPNLDSPCITQVQGDFTDPATARRACEGQALVVHCAASIGDDLADGRRVNVGGTGGLAAAAREAECERFLHISTLSVYDWSAVTVPLLDEDGPLKSAEKKYPHSPAASPFYGLTKAEGERALRVEMEKGLAATIFRPGIVLGVHPTSCWANQVPVKIRAGQVPLRGDGNDPLPWTHVLNLRYALQLALDHPASIGRAYNVFDGHISWRRYLEEVRSWFPDAPPAPTVEGESFIGRSSAARIVAELGYSTRHSYEEGMAEAGAWWRRGGPRV